MFNVQPFFAKIDMTDVYVRPSISHVISVRQRPLPWSMTLRPATSILFQLKDLFFRSMDH